LPLDDILRDLHATASPVIKFRSLYICTCFIHLLFSFFCSYFRKKDVLHVML